MNGLFYKFKYNILSGLSVFFLFIFTLLIGRIFGLSTETDIYFSIIALIYLLSVFIQIFYEAFFPYYAEIHKQNKEDSYNLYHSVYLTIIIVAIASILILLPFKLALLKFYLSGLKRNDLLLANKFFEIIIWDLIFFNLINFNNKFINIKLHYALPYIVLILTPLFNSLIVLFFGKKYGIVLIAYSTVLLHIISVLIQLLYINYFLEVKFRFIFKKQNLVSLFKSGCILRLAGGLNVLKNNIIIYFLSGLGSGYVTYFSYAKKFMRTIYEVACSPPLIIFQTNVMHLIAENKLNKIKDKIKKVFKHSIILFYSGVLIILLILPYFVKFIFKSKINEIQSKYIFYLFIGLIPYFTVLLLSQPYNHILLGFKKFSKILIYNIIYIALFVLSLIFFNHFNLKFYLTIPAALILSISVSFIIRSLAAKNLLKK